MAELHTCPGWLARRRSRAPNPTRCPVTQCNRTKSPARVSEKRPLYQMCAEIFGTVGQENINFGTRRLSGQRKKPANGGLLGIIPGKNSGDGNGWLGRQDSNLGMAESKSTALPLGYAPTRRTIAAPTPPINVRNQALYI